MMGSGRDYSVSVGGLGGVGCREGVGRGEKWVPLGMDSLAV